MQSLFARLRKSHIKKEGARRYRVPGRIAYLVNYSDPVSLAVSNAIATELVRHGYSVTAISFRGFHPGMSGHCHSYAAKQSEINGVRYIYLNEPYIRDKDSTDYLVVAAESIKEALRTFKPWLVIAAYDWKNALPGAIATRELSLPFIYQAQMLENCLSTALEPPPVQTKDQKQEKNLEHEVEQEADYVFRASATENLEALYSPASDLAQLLAVVRALLNDEKRKAAFSHYSMDSGAANVITKLPLKNIRVACIMDEFTFASYKDTCTLQQLSPGNWEEELNLLRPHILFIESAWRGKNDEWDRKIGKASPELLQIIDWCNRKNVRTMFWNKEDPIHYGTFLNTAKRFDYVFTTDLNCIGNYKRDLGHNNVYLLPFGCNPLDHNPIEKFQRKDQACFAGSYYVRYPERAKDLDVLLECFIEHSGVDIYDRNFGKDDVNYAFPDKYKPLILGNLKYDQIDVAYKSYKFGINLNSVKYSPTMFARRIYELLASNTFVVSNYSKGVRLQFGDLIVSSDAKSEIAKRIKQLTTDRLYADKLKLAGLRKVLSQHTYEDRFAYIAAKVLQNSTLSNSLPEVHVLAVVGNSLELSNVLKAFRRQSYQARSLHVLVKFDEFTFPKHAKANERYVKCNSAQTEHWANIPSIAYAAVFAPSNYYGQNYLTDLVLTTRYCTSKAIAKGTFYENVEQDGQTIRSDFPEYSYGDRFFYESALIAPALVPNLLTAVVSSNADTPVFLDAKQVFYIDRFNFCKGLKSSTKLKFNPASDFSDWQDIQAGIHMADLYRRSEAIEPSGKPKLNTNASQMFSLAYLYEKLNIRAAQERGIDCTIENDELKITARADAESPYYIYTNELIPIEQFWPHRSWKIFMETSAGLEVSPVGIFFDNKSERIGHSMPIANWNQFFAVPTNTHFIRFGIRVSGGPGSLFIKNIAFDHASLPHQIAWVPQSQVLLIAPNYPNYDHYYRYGFVHRRILGYRKNHFIPDVFRFRPNAELEFYEFDNTDVVTGGADILSTVMTFGKYKIIAIHALDSHMWQTIEQHLDRCKIVIWLHGAEVQSWKHRMFNYRSESEVNQARLRGEERDAFWKRIFALRHPNIHFVFVSNYFYHEVTSDLDVTCIENNVHIIHNPIDTELFRYLDKPAAQRKKILSIRPYASMVYANDVMVKIIIELSTRSFFDQLEFLVIGDGVLFDETIEPLREFTNVELRKGFISQTEIAMLHRQYGVFLCPSRMDTQGVSRDEAMASGLVPVTNAVGAIPEFVDQASGFACEPEDAIEMANCIERLYFDETLFASMSRAAAKAIRETRSSDHVCEAEIAVLSKGEEA
ncbi:MAG: glycosyltransferase [Methylobacter sp.]